MTNSHLIGSCLQTRGRIAAAGQLALPPSLPPSSTTLNINVPKTTQSRSSSSSFAAGRCTSTPDSTENEGSRRSWQVMHPGNQRVSPPFDLLVTVGQLLGLILLVGFSVKGAGLLLLLLSLSLSLSPDSLCLRSSGSNYGASPIN